MTRNSNKFNTPPEIEETPQQPQAPTPPPANQNNPFGLSFVTPVDTVMLPSRGLFYPVGHPLHQVESVEVRHMTAKEEDILSSTGNAAANLYEKLLNSLLVNKDLNSSHFIEEDKIAIILSARISGFGAEYTSTVTCEYCGSTSDREFDLTKRSIQDPETPAEYDPNTNTFSFELPRSKIQLKLLNLTQDIEDALDKERDQKMKYNLKFNRTISLLQKVIVSANSITDKNMISKMIDALPTVDARAIKDFYATSKPSLSLKQETTCPNCEAVEEREVPFSWALFRTDF